MRAALRAAHVGFGPLGIADAVVPGMANETATIKIKNSTGSNAVIQLFHHNPDTGIQSMCWWAKAGETVGSLVVKFQTGFGNYSDPDYWTVRVTMVNGSSVGVHQSQGYPYPFDALRNPFHSVIDSSIQWKECQLQSSDADQTHTFEVSASQFKIKLASGGTTTGMTTMSNPQKVTNVFVLMLENHSFDNIFARSGIANITKATNDSTNTYGSTTYHVTGPAPTCMPVDPGHEFEDVVEQLCGDGKVFVSGHAYPPINNSGFVANYAQDSIPVPSGDYGNVMACFDTSTQLPVIYELATQFAICDHWYSSMPGPTWPNRYFVHGGSSSNLDHSPSKALMGKWMSVDGFSYEHGSVFDALAAKNLRWRLYIDEQGPLSGSFAQVASIERIMQSRDVYDVAQLAEDLKWPYGPRYTFIEPNYGDASGDFSGGSSQHPRDGMYRGEQLIKQVYEAIRNSPAWMSSMLIVTYDEHGGFYDSVKPGTATKPGDSVTGDGALGLNQYGFAFDRYGARVPAVVISPWISKGKVDTTTYDHTSVPRTLEVLFGTKKLTERDEHAKDLGHLISQSSPRTDCVSVLTLGPADTLAPALTPEQQAQRDAEPMPESGNEIGFLHVACKTELELATDAAERDAIREKVAQIRTRGELRAYLEQVRRRVAAHRAAQGLVTSVAT